MVEIEQERELLERAQANDVTATKCLLLRYDDALRQYVKSIIGDVSVDANEIIRRTVQRTSNKVRSFKSEGDCPFRTGLLFVARDQVARALVKSAQTGDGGAAERLFSLYEREIKGFLRGRLVPSRKQDQESHQDSLHVEAKWHEVRQRAMRNLTNFSYERNGAFAAYLTTIAKNLCNDEWKRDRAIDHEQLESLSCWVNDGNPSPSSEIARRERAEALRVALAVLNSEQWTVVQGLLAGKSTAEIAAELGKTQGAVRALLQRAKERLHTEPGPTSLWFSKG